MNCIAHMSVQYNINITLERCHNISITSPGITCWEEEGVPEVEGQAKWDDAICTNLYNDNKSLCMYEQSTNHISLIKQA